jgi:putative SOS response-associated peptidase YedK
MCGRYKLVKLSDYIDQFPKYRGFELKPRYNIAPSQLAPIVRLDSDDQPIINLVKWGLIPSWTKGKPKKRPINARSETAATSPMFRQAYERRRCLVPADGFYEWKGVKPSKTPYHIHMKDGSTFAFAGLWERWKADDKPKPLDTFTILTTEPNELMADIHKRMPVIIERSDYSCWLDRKLPGSDVADLLRPYPAGKMEAWRVSSAVNSPKNDEEGIDKPVSQ